MTRRKHLDQRRARNQEIAERDAKARCSFCRKEFRYERWLFDGLEYCSIGCKADADEAREAMEAVKKKVCGKCDKSKPATRDFFPGNHKSKDGLDGWCRECKRASVREQRV